MASINSIISMIMAAVAFFTSFAANFKDNVANFRDTFFAPSVVADFDDKDEAAIRVMSFNIRFGDLGILTAEDRYDDVERKIEKGMPDSIGLQEATPAWMEYLKANLEAYDYVGVGRDDGVNQGEYAAVFYLKDKYTLVDSGTFWLSDTPDVPSIGWGADCYRICTWVVLENKETGVKYAHMNAHFDFANEAVFYNSGKLINEKAASFGDIPVVFTADMNFNEGSPYYNAMLAENVLYDTKYLAEDTMDYLTYHDRTPAAHNDNVIDFVMVNEKFDALVYKVVTANESAHYVSDHFPVYADIVIK